MRFLFFKVMLLMLTVLRMVFPSINVSYNCLPISFTVEHQSDIFLPAGTHTADVCEYTSIIQLNHQKNPDDNGKLLATFEWWGNAYPIFESADDGQTWEQIGSVTDDLNSGYYGEWMPFLYELPADIGEFEEGTVIFAATSITEAEVTGSTITLYKSDDLGRTFHAFCNVDEAGGIDWGVWEPYLIYDEESGRLFCFYSDDSDPVHSQKLVYKYSTDLVNWSEKYECVACDDPELRPGMVSVTKMGNGEYFMAYEMVGIDGNPIYCKRSASLDNWDDIADYGTIVSAAGKTFGSSPYAAWSPAGGKCGTLIVTAHHMVKGKSSTGTDMFLSFDYGKTFAPVDNPLPYTWKGHEKSGYSPSLFVSSDGATLYYVNNPSGYDSTYRIAMAKINLAEKSFCGLSVLTH